MSIKIAVCQVPDIREDIESSLTWIEKFTLQAEAEDASLICFPECFLQGYLTENGLAEKHALDLTSPEFKSILRKISKYKTTIVFGLIEREAQLLFNSAVVIKEGNFIGKYRKTHLLEGEKIFTAGTEYPVFEVKDEVSDLKFGINICYDTQFPEAAASLANQGAKLILCPANNMMRYETAEKYKHLHHGMRIERVKENNVWLLSSDVTGERDGRISYGPTAAIDPTGEIVSRLPLMETGILVVEI